MTNEQKRLIRSKLPCNISTYHTKKEYDQILADANSKDETLAYWVRDAVLAKLEKERKKRKK